MAVTELKTYLVDCDGGCGASLLIIDTCSYSEVRVEAEIHGWFYCGEHYCRACLHKDLPLK